MGIWMLRVLRIPGSSLQSIASLVSPGALFGGPRTFSCRSGNLALAAGDCGTGCGETGTTYQPGQPRSYLDIRQAGTGVGEHLAARSGQTWYCPPNFLLSILSVQFAAALQSRRYL